MKDAVKTTPRRYDKMSRIAVEVTTRKLRECRSFGLPLVAALLLALPAAGQDASMFRGDLAHTGVYGAAGVPSFSHVKWTFHVKGQLISSPAVDGETIYIGSTSTTLTQTVNKTNTTVTLASSANPSAFGASVTFTATVAPSTATGTVTFTNGSTTLGTGTISAGKATFS